MVTNQHSEMLDYLLEGKNPTEIARLINVSRQTIYNWLNLEYVQIELDKRKEDLRKQARDKINSHVCTYVDNMKDLACNAKDPRVRYQANKYLIDQAIGIASAAKEDDKAPGDDKNKDTNTLKKELDDIKNMRIDKR